MKTMILSLVAAFVIILSLGSGAVAQMGTEIDVQQYSKDELPDYFRALARASKPMAYPLLTLDSKSRVGHVGTLRTRAGGGQWRHQFITYTVSQQIEEGTLVEVTYEMPRATQILLGGYGGAGSGSRRLPAVHRTEGPFLFKSPATKDLASDAEFTPSGTWVVDGSFDYITTAGSTRRVLVIKELPADAHPLPEFPELLAKEVRTWKDKTGKYQVDAVLSDYERGEAKLRKLDGTVVSVSLSLLSEDDKEWVRQYLKQKREEEQEREQPARR